MGDVVFDKVLIVFANGDVQSLVGYKPSFVKWIFVRMPQRNEFVIAFEVRECEGRHPAHGLERGVTRPLQFLGKGRELFLVRHFVEAANSHIDGVDFPAAQQAHDFVAGLFQAQAALHLIRVVFGHADGVFVAEEVGRMQQVDMQRVTLDPFAAVDQPPQIADGAGYFDAARVFDGVTRAHLVGDGADTADAGGDVGCLVELAAAQKRLEEARRLENLQLDIRHFLALDLHQQGAFAFDTREVVDFDGPTFHALRSLCGKAQRRR